MNLNLPETDATRGEVRPCENPQFFPLEPGPLRCLRVEVTTVLVADESAAHDFDFQPRWWPGAYLREV